MRIHYLKHVPFEGLGMMESMFLKKGCILTRTCMYQDQSLPSIHEIDALLVMGGPMGVGDEDEYPWLVLEKEFIASVIQRNIPVIGVCLGAQLVANILGAKVEKNLQEEIGWFPVHSINFEEPYSEMFPTQFNAFHWHSDTFEIPKGAQRLLASEACTNQAFVYQDRVLGLQFHLEMMPSNVEALYQECGDPEAAGPYVQSLSDMLAPADYFHQASILVENLLQAFIFKQSTP